MPGQCMKQIAENFELDDSLLFCKLSSSIVLHAIVIITSGMQKEMVGKAL